jgi:hypothetical protein
MLILGSAVCFGSKADPQLKADTIRDKTTAESQMESAAESGVQATDKYTGWLDCSYDDQLTGLQLPWLPWVGTGFSEQKVRTIILGESVYDYSKGDAAKRKRILHADSLRLRHLNHAILAKFKSRYVRNFERAYYGKKKPSAAERQELWGGVVYHNLVLQMLHSEKARPSDADYTVGWEKFIDLAGCLDVQQVIVYGLERRKIDALRSLASLTGRIQRVDRPSPAGVKPIRLNVEMGSGSDLRMLFIRHPSAFFRWEEWGKVVQQFCRQLA